VGTFTHMRDRSESLQPLTFGSHSLVGQHERLGSNRWLRRSIHHLGFTATLSHSTLFGLLLGRDRKNQAVRPYSRPPPAFTEHWYLPTNFREPTHEGFQPALTTSCANQTVVFPRIYASLVVSRNNKLRVGGLIWPKRPKPQAATIILSATS
jgi:hypothetical protein